MSEYACRRNLPSDLDQRCHVALARDVGLRRIGRIATLTEPWGWGSAVMWDGGVLKSVGGAGPRPFIRQRQQIARRRRPPARAPVERAAEGQQLTRTSPHEPSRTNRAALLQCPATRGFVVGVVLWVSRWHARGQGFKSPQLHQAQRLHRLRARRRLPEICQKTRPAAARTPSALSGSGRPRGPARRPSTPA
jgi:hypothetical protein